MVDGARISAMYTIHALAVLFCGMRLCHTYNIAVGGGVVKRELGRAKNLRAHG